MKQKKNEIEKSDKNESNYKIIIINWIKNKFKKIIDKIDKPDKLNQVQQLAFDIFKICLYDENNIRYLNSGFSYKKYIVNKKFILDKDVSTFILLESNKITIVNHTYKYDVEMPQKTSSIMNKMFDIKVDEDRSDMEKEILGNISYSLSIVLNDFKNQLESSATVKKKTKS